MAVYKSVYRSCFRSWLPTYASGKTYPANLRISLEHQYTLFFRERRAAGNIERTQNPNNPDDTWYIVSLLKKVTSVSVETVDIVEGLPEVGLPELVEEA